MALSDFGLTVGSTAIAAKITHQQLHSAAYGTGSTAVIAGSRKAVSGTVAVDGDGDITVPANSWTGLTANQTVTHVTYWDAASGGNFMGGTSLTGDTAANAAGEYSIGPCVENAVAS